MYVAKINNVSLSIAFFNAAPYDNFGYTCGGYCVSAEWLSCQPKSFKVVRQVSLKFIYFFTLKFGGKIQLFKSVFNPVTFELPRHLKSKS